MDQVQAATYEIVNDWFENIPKVQEMIFKGEISTY